MKHFPLTILDGFYDNPNEILTLANSFEYFKDPEGSFPGSRTLPLIALDKNLDAYCSARFLSMFFDLDLAACSIQVLTQFQKVEPFSSDENSVLNDGWIHIDDAVVAAAVVYLTPDADPNCGTSFYTPKPDNNLLELDLKTDTRRSLYKDGIASEDYCKTLTEYNSNFIETVTVKNYYNRIVAYDANVYHKASTHFNNNKTRITQTFFLYNLQTTSDPLVERLNKIKKR
jgi:hypothetical protein